MPFYFFTYSLQQYLRDLRPEDIKGVWLDGEWVTCHVRNRFIIKRKFQLEFIRERPGHDDDGGRKRYKARVLAHGDPVGDPVGWPDEPTYEEVVEGLRATLRS